MCPSASTTPPAILVPPMSIPTLSTALLPLRARRAGAATAPCSLVARGASVHTPAGADRRAPARIDSNADLPENPAGTEGVAVVQFEVPAIVPADPQANVTDLLVERVKATPQLALFAVPDGDGWRDITAAEFHTSGHRPGQGLRRRRHRARRQGRLHRPHHLRLDARRLRAVLRRRRHGADLRDQLPRADRVEPHRLGRHRLHHRVGRPLRAPRRGARRRCRSSARCGRCTRGDLDKLVEQGKDVTDDEIERRRNIANGADIATLIYTSGSTGRPKGCVLTHSNFVELMPQLGQGAEARSSRRPAHRRCCSSRPRTSSRASSRSSTSTRA